MRRSLRELGPWERHKQLMKSRAGKCTSATGTLTDADALRDSHEFIRADGGQAPATATWGARLAARYYNKLLKEYALCDLSHYRAMKVGLRWRTEQEVVVGKGQFECASIACKAREQLASYELPFEYLEHGTVKQVCTHRWCCLLDASDIRIDLWLDTLPMEPAMKCCRCMNRRRAPTLARGQRRSKHYVGCQRTSPGLQHLCVLGTSAAGAQLLQPW